MGTSGEKTNDLKNEGGWASVGSSSSGSDMKDTRHGSSAASRRSQSNCSSGKEGAATVFTGLDSTVFDPASQHSSN